MDDNRKHATGYVGWATHGLFVVATAAGISGVVFIILEQPVGAGVCWIAAALGYGQLLNALLRR